MRSAKPTLGQVVGENVRRLRLEKGLTQDDFTLLLRINGLNWTRSNVASLESGRHTGVGFEAALLLAKTLSVRLSQLVTSDRDVVMDSTFPLPLPMSNDDLIRLASGGRLPPGAHSLEGIQARRGKRGVESYAAQKLHVSVERIRSAADRLYGQALDAERDKRLPKGIAMPAKRGHRGHVTRELIQELEAHLNKEKKS